MFLIIIILLIFLDTFFLFVAWLVGWLLLCGLFKLFNLLNHYKKIITQPRNPSDAEYFSYYQNIPFSSYYFSLDDEEAGKNLEEC